MKQVKEFKFRAWDTIDSEWKYSGHPHMPMWKFWESVELGGGYENVCQWTGLTDKNDHEIYESDLVSDGSRVWEIKWRSAPAGFGMFLIEKPKKKFDGRIGRFTTSLMDYQCEKLEVIGNVYENTELIKNR